MNVWDIGIILVIAAAVWFARRSRKRDIKKGCGGCCSSCCTACDDNKKMEG